MKLISLRKGQNLVDLALLIGIVGLVVIGMEAYIRRGVQGKVKDLTDYMISNQQAPDEDATDRRTSTSLESTATVKEFKGGGRSLTGDEKSISEYVPLK